MKAVPVHRAPLAFACLATSVAWLGFAAQSPPPNLPVASKDQATFFESKIRPILADKCAGCHGPGTQLSGLRLDTAEGLVKGGSRGAAVVPGDPDRSLLIRAVRQTGALKMPQGGRLSADEVADLEAWVKMGAPWPAASNPTQNARWWSLQPVRLPKVPKVHGYAVCKSPIDAFVLVKLEAKHLTLAPPTDRRTLIRRVTYDLTGLPPMPADVDAFIADRSADAYDKVVDRLLASPRYGERWGRLWLDVARYADTKGYVFNEDRNYANAYTYRDWVIGAFNRDLPYDRFVIEQLAADRLPDVENGDDKRPLAALGFLTVGRRFLNSTPDIIDDRIDVTMRGFEGFTVECARCHDHKFDPIPTQDYYSLYAVFNSSQEISAPISPKPVRDPWIAYSGRLAAVQRQEHDLLLAQMNRLRHLRRDPATSGSLAPDVTQILQTLREDQVPEGDQLKKVAPAFEPAQREALEQLQAEIKELAKRAPPMPEFAMAMEDKPHPSDGVVFKRGSAGSPGGPAPRRFLLALSKPGVERPHWTADSGRLELAEAIASKDNPLTARVFVNRVWLHLFGAGIVRTPSDFGHQGEPPTHPELLDYLAATFMNDGWSVKRLIRRIVLSATYRQASTTTPAAWAADPDDRLLSRMPIKRLDLEEMRDSLMAAAGRLDLSRVGGKSVDLWSEPFTGRRAVYGFVERQNLPAIFKTFDFATPDATSPMRFQTTVPQQALFFMNSPMCVDEAKALAARPEITASKDDAQRVRRLYRLLFQRLPDSRELALGLEYLKPGYAETLPAPAGAWRYGFGGYDPAAQRTIDFTPFAVYKDGSTHPTTAFPDSMLGYVSLQSGGGHPGRDGAHAAIRRWVAPADMTVEIRGVLAHRQPQGDGVRGRIVSSRSGLLGEWQVHDREQATEVAAVAVHKGDTIDFAVDCLANDAYDSFAWIPEVRSVDGRQAWNAMTNFGPLPGRGMERLALYAQALLMTNEFMFID